MRLWSDKMGECVRKQRENESYLFRATENETVC